MASMSMVEALALRQTPGEMQVRTPRQLSPVAVLPVLALLAAP